MKISLKNAAALATELSNLVTNPTTRMNLSIYGDNTPDGLDLRIANVIQGQTTIITTNMSLIRTTYALRRLIGIANEGIINELLTKHAELTKLIQNLSQLPVQSPPDLQQLSRQLTTKAALENPGIDHVTIPIPLDFSTLVRTLKRDLRETEAALAHFNFTTMIDLPEDVVTVLRDNDLV